MGKHRKKLEIVVDILSIARYGAKKTHIMYKGNLSFSLLSRYLDEVVTSGLVNREGCEYLLTPAGYKFLDLFADYAKNCEKLSLFSNRAEDLKGTLEEVLRGNVELQ